jgi:hypothetical protein
MTNVRTLQSMYVQYRGTIYIFIEVSLTMFLEEEKERIETIVTPIISLCPSLHLCLFRLRRAVRSYRLQANLSFS